MAVPRLLFPPDVSPGKGADGSPLPAGGISPASRASTAAWPASSADASAPASQSIW